MADAPKSTLTYKRGCPDCGMRTISLPPPSPEIGDDFDWLVRDYDGFRRFMLEDLAAHFPRRSAWTPADLEVVLVEALAARLDQLSDLLDRVTGESWLETARAPCSVRRLLSFIGFDAVKNARDGGLIPPGSSPPEATAELDALWVQRPDLMEYARRTGPSSIRQQRRMVTLADYAVRLKEHPLVLYAQAWCRWNGSWYAIYVAVIAAGNLPIDTTKGDATAVDAGLWAKVGDFHQSRGLPLPGQCTSNPTIRQILAAYVDAYRMVGQEVVLQDAGAVGISISLSIRVADNYFRSEVRAAIEAAISDFFAPGRLRFGQDIIAGDIFQILMALEGVDNVCLNRFKRVGAAYPDQTASGRILVGSLEVAVCENQTGVPERGYFHIKLHGGQPG